MQFHAECVALQHMWVRQEAGEGQWDVKELEKEIKSGGMFMKGEGRYWDNLS